MDWMEPPDGLEFCLLLLSPLFAEPLLGGREDMRVLNVGKENLSLIHDCHGHLFICSVRWGGDYLI